MRSFLGRQLSDAEADAWFDRYIVHFEAAWSLFPDAVPALTCSPTTTGTRSCRTPASTTRTASCASSAYATASRPSLCAAELGVSKPDAAAFHAACEALELRPQEVAYVGDQPDIDAGGAVAAGLTGIWLDRDRLGGRPELVRITGLDQLPGLLRGAIPVLERRTPSGNVLPAPPERAERSGREAQAKQTPSGGWFWWAMV